MSERTWRISSHVYFARCENLKMAPNKNRHENYGHLPAAISPGIRLLPILQALENYKREDLSADFRAALNVALLAFPQGMAYALVAGIPIKYGIFGSAVAAIAGSLFAGSRFIALGPTNATAVLLFGTFAGLQLTNADGAASGELQLNPGAQFDVLQRL